MKNDIEKKLFGIMLQYKANSYRKRKLAKFIEWIDKCTSQATKNLIHLFNEEELEIVWNKIDDEQIINIVKDDINKAIAIVFEELAYFLVIVGICFLGRSYERCFKLVSV